MATFSQQPPKQNDTNVDPSSTLQVVNALIKSNKNFDMLVMPGEDHPAGRAGAGANSPKNQNAALQIATMTSSLFDESRPNWGNVRASWE